MLKSVPSQYLGVWKRTLLEQQGSQDTSSLVLWIQTEQHHADIRIPALRPDFSNCEYLHDCSADQLRWLATQQGFTGTTEVQSTTCQWHREFDFQPKNDSRDIGEMVFDGNDTLLETGIDNPYFEVWKKTKYSHLNVSAHLVMGEDRHGVATPSRLLIAGNNFAYVRPRNANLPQASCLRVILDKYYQTMNLMLDWLDFEISFGEIIDDMTGIIHHSTLPFREEVEMPLTRQSF
jgi:hypothetical protein